MNDEQNPYQMPIGKASGESDSLDDLSILKPLVQGAGWTKFVGVMFIVMGAVSVLTIWGIIVAWIPIWMGILLLKFNKLIREGTGSGDPRLCRESLDKLRQFFKILGILMIVYIGIFVVAIFAGIMIPLLLTARKH